MGRGALHSRFQTKSQELQSLDVPSENIGAQTKNMWFLKALLSLSCLSLALWSSPGILLQVRGPQ